MAIKTKGLPCTKADCKALLEGAGIIPTKQRLDIAQVMLCRPQHLSAEQLLERVNAADANVSKATIYNTLSLFAARGVVRAVVVDPSRTFYDSNTEPHFHFYNQDTGTLADIYGDQLPADALPTAPVGTELIGVDVILRVRDLPSAD